MIPRTLSADATLTETSLVIYWHWSLVMLGPVHLDWMFKYKRAFALTSYWNSKSGPMQSVCQCAHSTHLTYPASRGRLHPVLKYSCRQWHLQDKSISHSAFCMHVWLHTKSRMQCTRVSEVWSLHMQMLCAAHGGSLEQDSPSLSPALNHLQYARMEKEGLEYIGPLYSVQKNAINLKSWVHKSEQSNQYYCS